VLKLAALVMRQAERIVRQAEVDAGVRPGSSSEESAELRRPRREVAELRRTNEILKAASAFFTDTGADKFAGDLFTPRRVGPSPPARVVLAP